MTRSVTRIGFDSTFQPALLWNAPPPPPPRKPRPVEHLWTMRNGGKQIDPDLRAHSEYGWEIVLLRNGEWSPGTAGTRAHPRLLELTTTAAA